MKTEKRVVHVFIVSDATGMTAERVITVVMAQFKKIKPIFKRFPYIRTKEQVEDIFARAEMHDGIVVYSVVSPDLDAWIQSEKRKRDVYTVNFFGPLLKRMGRLFNMMPHILYRPGLLRNVGEESIRVADAIDFTLRHDDGQGINTLGKADLILLGVSRTSKTPTSLYLSCNYSLRVANVPIILNVAPPKKIFTLKRRKVGFTITPEWLAAIRQKRLKYAGPLDYTDLAQIRRELAYSHGIFSQIEDLQIIDVTNSSIEEIVNRIMEERRMATT
jgi:regulator of PEP synthase PpsR (kinase-PPPase family)